MLPLTIIVQVEQDYNGLRNGHYSMSWGYQNESTQVGIETDSLPEKIYSMVSKLVDEDNEIDINQTMPCFQMKNNHGAAAGFYDGTQTWSEVPMSQSTAFNFRPDSPSDCTKDLLYAGLDQLDFSQNMLDLSFLNGDGFQKHNSRMGDNLDSGFASPAEKLSGLSGLTGLTGMTINSTDGVTGSAFNGSDWTHITNNALDQQNNQNYMNLLVQNPHLLDQIVRGDPTIDGILNESSLLQLDLQHLTDHSQSSLMMPHDPNCEELNMDLFRLSALNNFANECCDAEAMNSPSNPQLNLTRSTSSDHHAGSSSSSGGSGPDVQVRSGVTASPLPSMFLHSSVSNSLLPNISATHSNTGTVMSSLHSVASAPPASHPPVSSTSPLNAFSPYRPPPELPYPPVNGPLGYNNNNEYRALAGTPRNGINLDKMQSVENPLMFDNNEHDRRYLATNWHGIKAGPYGNGLLPMGNGLPNLPRFSPSGPFRSPPPFLPGPARLPLYPPSMDPAELYPLPCFQRHPLFPFPAPLYNLRQIRRNATRDELSARLDQCYEQFRQLEKERKKTEAELARHNPGKKLSSANSMTVPRLPPSPTRVDRLVVDQLREHARVSTLVAKMERLRGKPVGCDVHSSLTVWEDAIRKVQALRQEEVRCRSRIALEPSEYRAHQQEKGIRALAGGIHELSTASRHARTALWACLMVTLHVASPAPALAPALAPASNATAPTAASNLCTNGSLALLFAPLAATK